MPDGENDHTYQAEIKDILRIGLQGKKQLQKYQKGNLLQSGKMPGGRKYQTGRLAVFLYPSQKAVYAEINKIHVSEIRSGE